MEKVNLLMFKLVRFFSLRLILFVLNSLVSRIIKFSISFGTHRKNKSNFLCTLLTTLELKQTVKFSKVLETRNTYSLQVLRVVRVPFPPIPNHRPPKTLEVSRFSLLLCCWNSVPFSSSSGFRLCHFFFSSFGF